MAIKLNFKKFFTKESKNLISGPKGYKYLLRQKKGIRQDNAPKNIPAKGRNEPAKGFDHWMKNTGETIKKGFKFRAGKDYMLVFASGMKHSGKRRYQPYKDKKPAGAPVTRQSKSKPKYREIFDWHNKDRYSGVFGELPLGSRIYERFDKEANKQVQIQIEKEMRETVKGIDNVKII